MNVSDAERGDEHEVTPVELFFDLVFLFPITQVTSILANRGSPRPSPPP